jgi:AcrR family transcriptional regulator
MTIEELTARPPEPRSAARARTLRLLLREASAMLGDGLIPSVAEVALRAGVSRATAYRYFPSRSRLMSAVVEHSLGPVRFFASVNPDGRGRIDELFLKTFPRLAAHEPQLRVALQLSLEDAARERAGTLKEEPYRRGHRRRILSHAAWPLRESLGKRRFERLLRGLSVIYGIEVFVVLKDIWGANDREIGDIACWLARAMVDAALREAEAGRRGTGRKPARADETGNGLAHLNGAAVDLRKRRRSS